MFTNQEIVAIVFRLINFIALISVGFFLFKKHLLPDLLYSIAKKKDEQDFLVTQQAIFEKQQLKIDTLLKEDALLCEEFRSKIDEWKKVIILESDIREKKHNDTINASNERIAQIALQRECTRVQNIVTHKVVIDLEKSLSLHFNNKQQSSAYLDAILQFMDERTI